MSYLRKIQLSLFIKNAVFILGFILLVEESFAQLINRSELSAKAFENLQKSCSTECKALSIDFIFKYEEKHKSLGFEQKDQKQILDRGGVVSVDQIEGLKVDILFSSELSDAEKANYSKISELFIKSQVSVPIKINSLVLKSIPEKKPFNPALIPNNKERLYEFISFHFNALVLLVISLLLAVLFFLTSKMIMSTLNRISDSVIKTLTKSESQEQIVSSHPIDLEFKKILDTNKDILSTTYRMLSITEPLDANRFVSLLEAHHFNYIEFKPEEKICITKTLSQDKKHFNENDLNWLQVQLNKARRLSLLDPDLIDYRISNMDDHLLKLFASEEKNMSALAYVMRLNETKSWPYLIAHLNSSQKIELGNYLKKDVKSQINRDIKVEIVNTLDKIALDNINGTLIDSYSQFMDEDELKLLSLESNTKFLDPIKSFRNLNHEEIREVLFTFSLDELKVLIDIQLADKEKEEVINLLSIELRQRIEGIDINKIDIKAVRMMVKSKIRQFIQKSFAQKRELL